MFTEAVLQPVAAHCILRECRASIECDSVQLGNRSYWGRGHGDQTDSKPVGLGSIPSCPALDRRPVPVMIRSASEASANGSADDEPDGTAGVLHTSIDWVRFPGCLYAEAPCRLPNPVRPGESTASGPRFDRIAQWESAWVTTKRSRVRPPLWSCTRKTPECSLVLHGNARLRFREMSV